MNYRHLGDTGLLVSEIAFGCGNVGGLLIRGEPEERVRAVARAMELGVNYFDTAPSYGDGQSEVNLGRVLRELGAQVYVGTKVRLLGADARDIRGAITRSAEESLRRLGRDSVELIQLHNRIAVERGEATESLTVEDVLGDVVQAFESLREHGKTRYFGITALGETGPLHRVIDTGAFGTAQVCYNLLNPSAGDKVPSGFGAQDFQGTIGHAADEGTGVIAIRVLAAGALSGVEERHPVAAHNVPPIASGRDYLEDVSRARSLSFLVEEGYAADLVEASIRFVLGNDGVSTVLVGYSSIGQLERAVQSAERGPLPAEVLERLPRVWATFGGG